MTKLLSIIFIIIVLVVGSMSFIHARPKYDPLYQCKHIGISKVKPFKSRKVMKKAMQSLYSNPRYRQS
jgi:hypothetical protein